MYIADLESYDSILNGSAGVKFDSIGIVILIILLLCMESRSYQRVDCQLCSLVSFVKFTTNYSCHQLEKVLGEVSAKKQ